MSMNRNRSGESFAAIMSSITDEELTDEQRRARDWKGALAQRKQQNLEREFRSKVTLGTCARGIEVLEAMRDSLRDSDA